MLKLAVIGTFHQRHENTFKLMHRLFVDGTRHPDEAWLLCEDEDDAVAIRDALADLDELGLVDKNTVVPRIEVLPTPRSDNGGYSEIPYSRKINFALTHTTADLIVYLDNGSIPDAHKYETMAAALEANPSWGAVYCAQRRTGMHDTTAPADEIVEDGYCALNYTQVMHRLTADRWTSDMRHADPDDADGVFWRDLHESLGPFFPVGDRVLDEHHIPDAKAQGL